MFAVQVVLFTVLQTSLLKMAVNGEKILLGLQEKFSCNVASGRSAELEAGLSTCVSNIKTIQQQGS